MNSTNEEIVLLKEKVRSLLEKAGINSDKDIYYGDDEGDSSLEINIKKDANGWHWWEVERGKIQKDKVTTDTNEIMYWIVQYSVESKAGESVNWTARSKHKDPRRSWFSNSIKLMNKINSDWGEKLKYEYDQILKANL